MAFDAHAYSPLTKPSYSALSSKVERRREIVPACRIGDRRVNDRDGNAIGRSNWGLSADGQVGKEWWVSDNWGMGASLQFVFGKMDDAAPAGGGAGPTWTVTAFDVLLSATYN